VKIKQKMEGEASTRNQEAQRAYLPIEVVDLILAEAARGDILTTFIIPFVCHQAKKRMSLLYPPRFIPPEQEVEHSRKRVKVAEEAAKRGHLRVLKWLKAIGWPIDSKTFYEAAAGGHLDVLKWLNDNKCPGMDYELPATNAAANGHFEVLKWLRENGCPWSSNTCSSAAKNGHLHILKWARENGCKWDYKTITYAAEGGHLEVLKWLRENKCSWNSTACSAAAKKWTS